MMRSLYSGVAGLNTHQKKMDIIGNNIANVNTVAFKSSQTTFSDVMYQNQSNASGATEKTGGVNAKQVGIGSMTASIKTTIESTGATQSTGEAFDIYLSDGNSTNFFVVSNGQERLFTRAGSFYLDGAGNLAMTSTGYIVQGWQAVTDAKTGEVSIQKDTVSPIRLLTEANNTSEPEATTYGYAYGIVDKNDSNINSSNGYNMALSFYDSLGYEYTAKFTIKAYSPDDGTFTIQLANIYDPNNADILTTYRNETKAVYLNNPVTTTNATAGTTTTRPGSYPSMYNGTMTFLPDDVSTRLTVTDANGVQTVYVKEGTGFTGYEKVTDTSDTTRTYYEMDSNGTFTAATTPLDSSKTYYVQSGTGLAEIQVANSSDKPYVYAYQDEDGYTYAKVMNEEEVDDMLTARVFGTEEGSALSSYALKDSISLDENGYISFYDSEKDETFTFNMFDYNENHGTDSTKVNTIYKDENGVYHMMFQGDKGTLQEYALSKIFTGANAEAITELMAEKGTMGFNTKTGSLEIKYRDTNYELDFNEGSGSFDHIYQEGTNSVNLNVKNLGSNFENISVDYTSLRMANNGGSATASMDTGNIEEPTLGTGRKLGIMTGVSISQNGQIYGAYDNGTTRLLAQVAVAHFANASGLESLGNNLYATSLNSGSFNGIGVEITADGGKMMTGQLEMSNVDLSREFTEMITTQRGFQANSRIITVSDTMLEELTNLKR